MRRFIGMSFISTVYSNDVSAYIPQLWAQESLAILYENLVVANLVHRDFSNVVASYGDTINTRRPGKFKAIRRGMSDDVTDQDLTATNVAVKLDQLPHVSFLLRDAEASKAFKDLVTEYLDPAIKGMAKFVDQVVIGQMPQFMANGVGGLGTMNSTNVKSYILAARNKQNTLLAPEDGRNFIWTPNAETQALSLDLFTASYAVGDGGNALANAALGRKFGYDNYMSQLASSVPAASAPTTNGAINNASGYNVGATALTVDGFSAAIAANSWITINGIPYRVASTTGGSTPTVITIAAPGLLYAVADNDVVKVVTPSTVSGAYAAGYDKAITVNGGTPAVGQWVTFQSGAGTSAVYTIVQVSGSTIVLDRGLEVALSNSDAINYGPSGEFSFAFNRNAISLVTRPLATPMQGIGAQSAVVSFNGLSMRATLSYDTRASGTRVTLDMLMGVKVLDTNQGVPIYG